MDNSTTSLIAARLTRAIVEHRLQPGTKLAEQKLADHFGVSRTLVRQALFQLSQNRLVRLEPARGAFVAAPSADEARQVFAVRRMIAVSGVLYTVLVDDLRDQYPGELVAKRSARKSTNARTRAAVWWRWG